MIDIGVHRARGDKVVDGHGIAFLAVAIDSANALFYAHGIPGEVVVHQAVAKLVVEAFTTHLGGEQDVERLVVLTFQAEAAALPMALIVRSSAMDTSDSEPASLHKTVNTTGGLPPDGGHHELQVLVSVNLFEDLSLYFQQAVMQGPLRRSKRHLHSFRFTRSEDPDVPSAGTIDDAGEGVATLHIANQSDALGRRKIAAAKPRE
jgi:hypothetical protein